jgi:hypothetical protein
VPGGAAVSTGSDVAIADHPKYGKYFRMLKVGLPRDAIKAKMQHEGMNPLSIYIYIYVYLIFSPGVCSSTYQNL